MNFYLDVFPGDTLDSNTIATMQLRQAEEQDRSGPCEDDAEETAPYIGLCPEESDNREGGSPLSLGGVKYIDSMIEVAYRMGW